MDLAHRQKRMKQVQIAIAFAAAIYQLIATKFVIFPTDQHKSIHLTFCLLLTFMMQYDLKKKWFNPRNLVTELGIVVAILVGIYVHILYFQLMNRLGNLNTYDLVVGVCIITFALLASWRDWGAIIPIIVLGAIAYALYGQYIPGSWFHAGISFKRVVGICSMYMSGIYGSLLRISSLEVIMFILFGSVLDASGGGDLFMIVAKACGRRLRSGMAQVAVISSALFGTISGNIAANVATTGAITIPSMKKSGLSAEFAGAVEAVASTGGQIMPPVMGVAAFLIVGITGIPYNLVMKAAIFPAIAYYLYLGVAIQIRACKQNWRVVEEDLEAPKKQGGILKNYWHIFIAFIALGYCLYIQIAPVLMANYITVTLLLTTTVKWVLESLKGDKAGLLKKLQVFYVQGLSQGVLTCVKLTVSICTLGILVEVFTATGFAQTFAFNMVQFAGSSLFLLSVMIFVTCTFFGMGMTATSAYLLVAMLGAPAMVKFGVPVLAAHLFCFYYGIMSSVTPPVARGVLVACGMANGNFWKTAGHSIRLALPGFLLPFYFVFEPDILWYENSFLTSLYVFLVVICGLIALSVLFEQYYFVKLHAVDNLIFGIIVVCSLWPEPISNVIALALFIVATGWHIVRYRSLESSSSVNPPASSLQK